jgi:hypothetical protein
MSVVVPKPACMTEEEFADWSYWNDQLPEGPKRATSACVDCFAAFAKSMRKEERCDGRYPREGAKKRWVGKLSPSERLKALWADPEYRAYMAARRAASTKPTGKAGHRDPERTRQLLAAAMRAKWEDPEYRARISASRAAARRRAAEEKAA